METEMARGINLPAQREIIMDMLFDLIRSLTPEDSLGLTKDTEERAVEIYDALSYALQIPREDSI
jgi:hypothetical protein